MKATAFDLLLQNGFIFDPSTGTRHVADIGIANGRIHAIGPDLPGQQAGRVLDLSGAFVTPGLIDMHAHVYRGVMVLAVDGDSTCLPQGVTTVVDAGSAGSHTFPGLRDYVVAQSQLRIVPFLHVSVVGLASPPQAGELCDLRMADLEGASQLIGERSNGIRGVKIRMSRRAVTSSDAPEALRRAKRLAEGAGLPLMVHIWDSPIALAAILAQLGSGDILTHIYHGDGETVLDDDGRVRPEVLEASKRGIALDVGHAGVGMDLRVARLAMEQGLLPTTISTDLHKPPSERPNYSLPDLVSEFVALGLPLGEAVAAVTSRAATQLGMAEEIGRLTSGAAADIAVFRKADRPVRYRDSVGNEVRGSLRLEPQLVIRAGKLLEAHAVELYAKPDLIDR